MTTLEKFNQAVRNEKRFKAIMDSNLDIKTRFEAKKKYSKWSDIADKLYNELYS
jgi:hypothetical protein